MDISSNTRHAYSSRRAAKKMMNTKRYGKNEGLSEQQQKTVSEVMSKVVRNLTWKYPVIRQIETLTMDNVSKDDQISELTKLTDTSVVYRLPPRIPSD